MQVPKVCPLIFALQKNPNLIKLKEEKAAYKTMEQVLKSKPIGKDAKTDAWWRPEYREAKEIQDAIEAGTYKFPEPDYDDNGFHNLKKFHPQWDPYGDDGLI